jgi:hypothetical protein
MGFLTPTSLMWVPLFLLSYAAGAVTPRHKANLGCAPGGSPSDNVTVIDMKAMQDPVHDRRQEQTHDRNQDQAAVQSVE